MNTAADPIRPLVAGNWKMNGLKATLSEAQHLREAQAGAAWAANADVMLCPPATLLMLLAEILKGSNILIGAQDCHSDASGAYTGDVAATMVADAGAVATILGHSERRAGHGERDGDVLAKVKVAHAAGLAAIVCVGETAGARAAGLTLPVVQRQLRGSLPDGARAVDTIIAYEPVWAIGTGLTPSILDVAEVHGAIRQALMVRYGDEGRHMRILYGGSVKPGNARELMAIANVNGALVGGASLKAADFLGIISAYGP